MIDDKLKQSISSERFHQVLRPWNIFNACDLDGSHNLDEKELDILLWFQLRKRQTQEVVRQFMGLLDADGDGNVSRMEWVQKVVIASDVGQERQTQSSVVHHRMSEVERRNSVMMHELLKT